MIQVIGIVEFSDEGSEVPINQLKICLMNLFKILVQLDQKLLRREDSSTSKSVRLCFRSCKWRGLGRLSHSLRDDNKVNKFGFYSNYNHNLGRFPLHGV